MDYKRLELYVGWTCNQKCSYCIEFSNMEKAWDKKVTKNDILKKLISYKIKGYNHVTFLGGEPFIQGVFLDALKIGKKLGYTILVTTNCTTLHIESQAKKFLPYIDELFLSVQAIGNEEQKEISRTNNYVSWDLVFENIKKYWKGNFLKANIVITKLNVLKIYEIVVFLNKKGVKNISITYPDLDPEYYSIEHTLNFVAPKYSECINEIIKIINYSKMNNIGLKLADFPFCVFPKDKLQEYIKFTDDYDYATRLKLSHEGQELDRNEMQEKGIALPRERKHFFKCHGCIYISKCWGPSLYYNELYGLNEINHIKQGSI